ncbi:MAG: hypothetical protein ABIO55_10370 [Ginsengibacter sp.]
MLSVKGIYDGENIKLLEKPEHITPGKVIITFIENETEIDNLREYTTDEDSFNFWNEEEDMYQDYLKKK